MDRRTRYLREQLVPLPSSDSVYIRNQRILFKVVAYRLVNRLQTFQEVGLPEPEGLEEHLEDLSALMAQGETLFTSAHQNCGLGGYLKGITYVRDHLHNMSAYLEEAATLEKYLRILK